MARRGRRTPGCRGCRRRPRRRCRPRPRRAARGRRCRRARPVIAAVDGEVQHVDAVGDGPVDGRDQVGRGAAVVARVGGGPARLVDREPRLGGGPGVQPGALSGDLDGDAGVARGDRGHQRPVAVVVERRQAGAAADAVGAEPVDEPVRTHDLVVALLGGPSGPGRAAAPEVAGRPAESADVGEQRAVGPQPGVDEPDDDAGPAETRVGRPWRRGRRAATAARRRTASGSTLATAGSAASARAWSAVSRTAYPLSAVVQR